MIKGAGQSLSKPGADAPEQFSIRKMKVLLLCVCRAGGKIPPRYVPVDDTPAAGDASREALGEFADDLSWVFTNYELFPRWRSNDLARKNYEKLRSIRTQAKMLSRGLEDEAVAPGLSRHVPIDPLTGFGFADIVEGISLLVKACSSRREELKAMGLHDHAPLADQTVTRQEQLFLNLAATYRKGLDAEPKDKLVTSYHDPQGPFVAFVNAAYRLGGLPSLKPSALEKALSKLPSKS